MRDLALKPREENELPVEKLIDVLIAIYPEKNRRGRIEKSWV